MWTPLVFRWLRQALTYFYMNICWIMVFSVIGVVCVLKPRPYKMCGTEIEYISPLWQIS
jgi:hypothetical protein